MHYADVRRWKVNTTKYRLMVSTTIPLNRIYLILLTDTYTFWDAFKYNYKHYNHDHDEHNDHDDNDDE